MLRRKMHVVSDWTRGRHNAVIGQRAPIMTGDGDTDHVCAICETTLIASMRIEQVRDLVLKCPRCGTINEVVDTAAALH